MTDVARSGLLALAAQASHSQVYPSMFPHSPLAHGRGWRLVAIAFAIGGALFAPSCSLFPSAAQVSTSESGGFLKPAQTALDAIQFEFVTIDRAADDPLLGDALWREVDQIASLSAEARQKLRANGLRVGLVGAAPCLTLQTLLKFSDTTNEADTDRETSDARRRLVIRPGQDVPVMLSPEPSRLEPVWWEQGEEKTAPFENARGLLVVRGNRAQDGWLRVQLTPEVHFGEHKLRPTATGEGWQFQGRQTVQTFADLRVVIDTNVGESVLVTCQNERDSLLGPQLFQYRDAEGRLRQRLLLIRVANMARLEPVLTSQQ